MASEKVSVAVTLVRQLSNSKNILKTVTSLLFGSGKVTKKVKTLFRNFGLGSGSGMTTFALVASAPLLAIAIKQWHCRFLRKPMESHLRYFYLHHSRSMMFSFLAKPYLAQQSEWRRTAMHQEDDDEEEDEDADISAMMKSSPDQQQQHRRLPGTRGRGRGRARTLGGGRGRGRGGRGGAGRFDASDTPSERGDVVYVYFRTLDFGLNRGEVCPLLSPAIAAMGKTAAGDSNEPQPPQSPAGVLALPRAQLVDAQTVQWLLFLERLWTYVYRGPQDTPPVAIETILDFHWLVVVHLTMAIQEAVSMRTVKEKYKDGEVLQQCLHRAIVFQQYFCSRAEKLFALHPISVEAQGRLQAFRAQLKRQNRNSTEPCAPTPYLPTELLQEALAIVQGNTLSRVQALGLIGRTLGYTKFVCLVVLKVGYGVLGFLLPNIGSVKYLLQRNSGVEDREVDDDLPKKERKWWGVLQNEAQNLCLFLGMTAFGHVINIIDSTIGDSLTKLVIPALRTAAVNSLAVSDTAIFFVPGRRSVVRKLSAALGIVEEIDGILGDHLLFHSTAAVLAVKGIHSYRTLLGLGFGSLVASFRLSDSYWSLQHEVAYFAFMNDRSLYDRDVQQHPNALFDVGDTAFLFRHDRYNRRQLQQAGMRYDHQQHTSVPAVFSRAFESDVPTAHLGLSTLLLAAQETPKASSDQLPGLSCVSSDCLWSNGGGSVEKNRWFGRGLRFWVEKGVGLSSHGGKPSQITAESTYQIESHEAALCRFENVKRGDDGLQPSSRPSNSPPGGDPATAEGMEGIRYYGGAPDLDNDSEDDEGFIQRGKEKHRKGTESSSGGTGGKVPGIKAIVGLKMHTLLRADAMEVPLARQAAQKRLEKLTADCALLAPGTALADYLKVNVQASVLARSVLGGMQTPIESLTESILFGYLSYCAEANERSARQEEDDVHVPQTTQSKNRAPPHPNKSTAGGRKGGKKKNKKNSNKGAQHLALSSAKDWVELFSHQTYLFQKLMVSFVDNNVSPHPALSQQLVSWTKGLLVGRSRYTAYSRTSTDISRLVGRLEQRWELGEDEMTQLLRGLSNLSQCIQLGEPIPHHRRPRARAHRQSNGEGEEMKMEGENRIDRSFPTALSPSTELLLPCVAEWLSHPLKPIHSFSITFVNVSFAYPQSPRRLVLNKVSFHVRSGEFVGIVGPTGAGKSTVMALLLQLYRPTEGQILINELPIEQYPTRWLRRRFGYVGQQQGMGAGGLLNSTVDQNIALSDLRAASSSQVRKEALLGAQCRFIYTKPLKEKTVVGRPQSHQANPLSGGEVQRLAIARVLAKDKKTTACYLLDEATSALDVETEHRVQKALFALSDDSERSTTVTASPRQPTEEVPRRTVLCIAHRLFTLKCADKIIVLGSPPTPMESAPEREGGRRQKKKVQQQASEPCGVTVVEEGSFAELATKEGGVFAGMVNAQQVFELGRLSEKEEEGHSSTGSGFEKSETGSEAKQGSSEIRSAGGAEDGKPKGSIAAVKYAVCAYQEALMNRFDPSSTPQQLKKLVAVSAALSSKC